MDGLVFIDDIGRVIGCTLFEQSKIIREDNVEVILTKMFNSFYSLETKVSQEMCVFVSKYFFDKGEYSYLDLLDTPAIFSVTLLKGKELNENINEIISVQGINFY